MYILAIDPGLTTGACILDATPTGFKVVTAVEIPWAQRFSMLAAFVLDMSSLLPSTPVAFVVESFRLRQGRAFQLSGSDFPSSQVIGAFECLLHMYNMSHLLTMQEPGVMSRVQILPEHFYDVEGSEHKKDAYKHARYYFVTKVLGS